MSAAVLYVPLTGCTWEPTDDPSWWRMVDVCDDGCHHPAHALGHPERLRHLEDAQWIRDNGRPVVDPATKPDHTTSPDYQRALARARGQETP